MKAKFTLADMVTKMLFAASILVPVAGMSQTWNEDFSSSDKVKDYNIYGYTFGKASLDDAKGSIDGNSVYSNDLTPTSNTYFASGYFYLSGGNYNLSFNHQAVAKSFKFQPELSVHLEDTAGNELAAFYDFAYTDDNLYAANSIIPSGSYSAGWYKIVFRWNTQTKGGGTERISVDDIVSNIPVLAITGKSTRLADIASTLQVSAGTVGGNNSSIRFQFTNNGPDEADAFTSKSIFVTGVDLADLKVTGRKNASFNSKTGEISINSLSDGEIAYVQLSFNRISAQPIEIQSQPNALIAMTDPKVSNDFTSFKEFMLLPISLISFNLNKLSFDQVELKWEIENSDNISFTEVQRSSDGVGFSIISGSSVAHATNYYNDLEKIAAGNIFYRLKFTEKSGGISYSAILRISKESAISQISVYPNPAKDYIILQLKEQAKEIRVTIVDNAGRIVMTRLGNNSTTLSIGLGNLPRGLYRIVALADGEKMAKTFIKF